MAGLRRFARIARSLWKLGLLCESIRANSPDSRCESPSQLIAILNRSSWILPCCDSTHFLLLAAEVLAIPGPRFCIMDEDNMNPLRNDPLWHWQWPRHGGSHCGTHQSSITIDRAIRKLLSAALAWRVYTRPMLSSEKELKTSEGVKLPRERCWPLWEAPLLVGGAGSFWGGGKPLGCFTIAQRNFLWVTRRALPRERLTSGKVRLLTGRSTELLGRSGNLPGKLWSARKSTGREVARKSPGIFRRTGGDILGSRGSFQEVWGSLTRS